METLDTLYMELFTKVMEDDLKSQLYYLSMVADHRNISVDYLLELGALFIPNNDYISHYLGDKVFKSYVGLYYQETCPWTLFVIIPIRNLGGEVVGLVGWDAYNKYKEVAEGEQGLVSYRVSAKSVFAREKYFLSDISCLKKNFEHRVIFITDGVFDAISLNYRGIPAIALLGSSFSQEILYFLSWYKTIYVCADNDVAGSNLVRKLSKAAANVYRVSQSSTKDIEELLRRDGIDGPITKQLKSLVTCPIRGNVMLGGSQNTSSFGVRRLRLDSITRNKP